MHLEEPRDEQDDEGAPGLAMAVRLQRQEVLQRAHTHTATPRDYGI